MILSGRRISCMLDAIPSPVEHPIDQERFATNVSQRSHLPQQLQIRSCGCIYRRLSSIEASTRITAEIGGRLRAWHFWGSTACFIRKSFLNTSTPLTADTNPCSKRPF